ncbi:tetratricopeptide repeat protein [Myroides pelagicus]|uniref:Tetratricopeptide repeat protein n=1 Tax=Myroides pelagicus TaxID=270914 RepID=A0A7K1GMM4_9FLAO|nr:hypothetical protein [Myroides pelagicus]MTH30106.1 hypothetical protein [Myroides pelagicus]
MIKRNKISLTLLMGLLCSSGVLRAQDIEGAKKAIQGHQFDKAKSILRTLIADKPNEGANYYYLGDIYLQEKQVDSANYFFTNGLGQKKEGFLNNIGLGQLDLDNNRLSEAKAKFDNVEKELRRKDYNEKLLIAGAYLNSSNPNYDEAIKIANKVLEEDYQNANAFLIKGKASLAKNDINEAYSAFSDAAILDPNLLEARMELAILTKRTRAFEQALESFATIHKEFPEYAPVYKEIADTYYLWATTDKNKEKSLKYKAKEAYEKYVEATGNSAEAILKYAEFLKDIGDYPALANTATKLIEKGQGDKGYRLAGLAAFNLEDFKLSSQNFDKIAKPTSDDKFYLGLSLFKLGEDSYANGIEQLKAAVAKDGALASKFNAYGVELYRADKYKEAIDLLSISGSVKEQSNYSFDNYYVGYCNYMLGTEDEANQKIYMNEAIKYFNIVIESNPKITEAYFFKARAYRYMDTEQAYQGRFSALKQYEQTMFANFSESEFSNTDKDRLVEAYNAMGAYYANSDELDNARKMFAKTLKYDATNEFAKKTLEAISL